MRFRAFLVFLLPYVAGLSLLFFFSLYLIDRATQEQSKIIAHQEYVRINQDIARLMEKDDDYEEGIKSYIERYKIGNITYAWLIDSTGKELAFSQNKRFMTPDVLIHDKERVLPYIKDNRPSGITVFASAKNRKIVEYAPIPGTSLILVMVFLLPNENLLLFNGYSIQLVLSILFLVLILAGYIWSIHSSKLFSQSMEKLTTMVLQVSLEEPLEGAESLKDPEFALAVSFLQRIESILKERKASDLNPLTRLPGTISLQEQLFTIIDTHDQFSVAALDIARFSAFNHKYGFNRGDSVIRFLASTVQSMLAEKGEKGDFAAHLGGDHFVFLTRTKSVDDICTEIIKTFDEHIPLFYEEDDRRRGFILSKNRQGEINTFGLMMLVIGVATNVKRPLIHPLQIAHITSEITEFLKKKDKSMYLIDRRASDREPAEYKPEEGKEPTAGDTVIITSVERSPEAPESPATGSVTSAHETGKSLEASTEPQDTGTETAPAGENASADVPEAEESTPEQAPDNKSV
jgi:GGDEF domain-containing protein